MTKEVGAVALADLMRLKRLRLLDDDFMKVCFQGNVEAAQAVLDAILPEEKLQVEIVQTQYEIKNLYGRSAELDIHARDVRGRRINVEVQRKSKGARPRRARYHASLLDAGSIGSGKDTELLPDNYVIFITEKDYFGKGEPLYHIERMVEECGSVFGDGSHIIYVNRAYEGDDAVGHLMHDFRCEKPGEMYHQALRDVAKYFKETQEGQKKMCQIWDEVRQEGRELGRREAVENGLQAMVSTLKPILKDFSAVYDAIITNDVYCNVREEQVREIYMMV